MIRRILLTAVAVVALSGCGAIEQRAAQQYMAVRAGCNNGDQASCMELAGLIQRCENARVSGQVAAQNNLVMEGFRTPAENLGAGLGTAIGSAINEAAACGGQPGYEVTTVSQ